jgi:hypothetical protein
MNGNEEVLFSARWSTITLPQKSVRDFFNAHLHARWLAGRRNADICAHGILFSL